MHRLPAVRVAVRIEWQRQSEQLVPLSLPSQLIRRSGPFTLPSGPGNQLYWQLFLAAPPAHMHGGLVPRIRYCVTQVTQLELPRGPVPGPWRLAQSAQWLGCTAALGAPIRGLAAMEGAGTNPLGIQGGPGGTHTGYAGVDPRVTGRPARRAHQLARVTPARPADLQQESSGNPAATEARQPRQRRMGLAAAGTGAEWSCQLR